MKWGKRGSGRDAGWERKPQARPRAGMHGLLGIGSSPVYVSSQTFMFFTPGKIGASDFSKEKLKTTYIPIYFYPNFRKELKG